MPSFSVRFIADVGSNFGGSLDGALEYVSACASAGVDVVKFQCWRAEDLLSPHHPAFERASSSLWGLPLEWHRTLAERAGELGILFSTTPTQPHQIPVLEDAGVDIYKVASGDITFFALLDELNKTGKKVVLSTGMADLCEVERALSRLTNCEVVLLHCVSLYPPPFEELNLRAIQTLKEHFPECEVGLSDHSEGWDAVLAAVALGAVWVEKHITTSRSLPTPDASFALTVEEFGEMVARVRRVEAALGSGVKAPSRGEVPERFWARRGIYASRPLCRGEVLSPETVVFLRPCNGIPADAWDAVEGRRVSRDLKPFEPISFRDLE